MGKALNLNNYVVNGVVLEIITKVFRDPVHNVIDLDTGDKTTNELIIKLIDSKEFQRLHFIKQLGFAYVAYPNATHTRFEHSLGVAFLAKRLIEKIITLEEKTLSFFEKSKNRSKLIDFFEQTKRNKSLTIIAALLHDIGHGPLSHVIEGQTGIKHEKWTSEIILGKTEINDLLVKFDKSYPQAIVDMLNESKEPQAKIIAGQLDIDKMDYLLRDSYMTGAGYGKFDIEWLFNVITIGLSKDKQVEIGLDLGKGLSVAENLIMARIDMFKNVYLHKTNLVAQNMLKLLLKRMEKIPQRDICSYFPNESLRRTLFSKNMETSQLLADYLSITDLDLFYHIKLWQDSNDPVIKRISHGLINRRLFKEVDQDWYFHLKESLSHSQDQGMNYYYIIELIIKAKEERLTYQVDKDKVFLFDKDGTSYEIQEKSEIIPPRMRDEIIHLGYYADPDLYEQFPLKQKENERKFEIKMDRSRIEELMELSIEEALKSVDEDERVHPKVGAVLCDASGEVLLTAFRGKRNKGDHCEYSLLMEAEERGIDCHDTVLFVTLEPCTTRGPNKTPCAERIVNAGIPMVFIGSLDPNDDIRGKGELFLRDHAEVDRYPSRFIIKLREINRAFENQHRPNSDKIKSL